LQNRRQHERIALGIELEITPMGGSSYQTDLLNLSVSGLFIKSRGEEEIGTICRVEILLCEPGDPLNVWFEGEVRRITDDGIGVRIDSIFQDSLDRLQNLLEMSGRLAA